jgi:predicted dehydrogenase
MFMNPPLDRKLRMGLVGGAGGFIGRVHALAAQRHGRVALVAGALSSDPAKAKAAAYDFGIPTERAYGSYEEMADKEPKLPAAQRLDFVSVATPNNTHFAIARAFVEAGLNVVCDKPMTYDLQEAHELARIVEKAGVVFAVTHNYTGYTLVRQARSLIEAGALGEIQAFRVSYLQGSLRRQRTPEQQRRSAWKTDPARAGPSGCFGDIGTHAYNLARFMTGVVPEEISCHLEQFMGGPLDDYGCAFLRCANGAIGTLTASRISHGRDNDLAIEVDGTLGALAWRQEEPNELAIRINGQPRQLLTRERGVPCALEAAVEAYHDLSSDPERGIDGLRLSESYLDAFANVYAAVFVDIVSRAAGRTNDDSTRLYPNVHDGVEIMAFITGCVASSRETGAWRPLGPSERENRRG